MKDYQSCICSAALKRRPFSDYFDSLHCDTCDSSHFVATSTGNGAAVSDFQYGGDNEKYTEKSYLYGKQLRWAHLELLKRDWAGRKVLEIGCFNGFFLDELKKRGADVYGFDVNQDAVAVGNELFGLAGRLEVSLERLSTHGPFDDVLCIDVLEHLEQPGAFVDKLSALLQPEGYLTVAGPTTERRFHDKSDFPPHHKWWFSRPGIKKMLQQYGFQVVSTSIQRDGMLFVRNFIGRTLIGLRKREFYGDTLITAPRMESGLRQVLYVTSSMLGVALFKALRISYCSTIFIAQRPRHS